MAERDYYAEEIEGKDTTDYYSEEILKKPAKTEPFLKRAIDRAAQTIPPQAMTPLTKLGEGLGDVYGPSTEFINQAGFGLVRPGFKGATGLDLPQASSGMGKAMQVTAGATGFLGGGPGRAVSAPPKALLRSIFKKEIAQAKLPQATGRLSKSIQEIIKAGKKDKSLWINKEEILGPMREGLKNIDEPFGPGLSNAKKWIKKLEKAPDLVSPKRVERIETTFGKLAKFEPQSAPKDPGLNIYFKEIRDIASKKFDEIAKKAGVKEFAKASAEKSKLLAQRKSTPSILEAAFPPVRRAKQVVGKKIDWLLKKL